MISLARIQLRELRQEDWKSVHSYASIEEVCQYQPWGPNTEGESQAYVHAIIEDASLNPRKRFAYVILEGESVIGVCELNVRDAANLYGEISYILHPDWWGQGFATEAATMLLSYAFDDLKLHKVSATCNPENIGSKRVLEKIGMVKEGLLREHLKMLNGWRNSLLFSMLDREWKSI
ncbi:MAG: GNAT family protein [Anaerobacillus sp.]